MTLDDEVSLMLEVKEGTEIKTVQDFVSKLGYTLDENYKVPMKPNKTIIYLISGSKNNVDSVDKELRKQDWVYGVWSNPKMDYFGNKEKGCC